MQLTLQERLSFPCGVAPGFDPTHIAAGKTRLSALASGTNMVNFLTGTPATVVTGTGAPTSKINGIIGPTTRFPTSSGTGYVKFTGNDATNYTTLTLAAICSFEATSTGIVQGIVASAIVSGTGVQLCISNANSIALIVSGGGIADSLFVPATNVPYFIAASWNGANVNFVIVNLSNGKTTTATAALATTSLGAPAGNYCVGNVCSVTKEMQGIVAAAMYSGQYNSMSVLTQWAQDPWSFWYPRNFETPDTFIGGLLGTLYNVSVNAICTSSAVLQRTVGKMITATCTSTSALIRTISKTLTALCTSTSLVSAVKAHLLTLTATCTSSASLIKNTAFVRSLTATCTSTSMMIKGVSKTLTASCTSTSVLIRTISKKLTATCTTALTGVARKCILYTQTVIATCTSSATVSTIKSLAGAVLSLAAKLRPYKPQTAPVLPGNDTLYLLNELHKVSNAFNAHVQATKDLDARLKAAGF